jgi:hypothetical protein
MKIQSASALRGELGALIDDVRGREEALGGAFQIWSTDNSASRIGVELAYALACRGLADADHIGQQLTVLLASITGSIESMNAENDRIRAKAMQAIELLDAAVIQAKSASAPEFVV